MTFSTSAQIVSLIVLATSLCQGKTTPASPSPLDLAKRCKPFPTSAVYSEEDYHVWGAQVVEQKNNKYYMVYSRWAKKGGHWLKTSEVCLAEADQLIGPYRHLKILLHGRGPGHWDELMAHNPKIKHFNGKYYLYHISSQTGPTYGHIRDSQRTGVAVADQITGPYKTSNQPIINPGQPAYNITVNPGVTQMKDGRYLMIIKGDLKQKKPTDPMGQRVQALALSKTPEGPFIMQPKPALHDIDSEDASIWYDQKRDKYYAIYHAHKYLGLLSSNDGLHWDRAENNIITYNKLQRKDGTTLFSKRPLQRPNVFRENNQYKAMTVSVEDRNGWYCVVVPLSD